MQNKHTLESGFYIFKLYDDWLTDQKTNWLPNRQTDRTTDRQTDRHTDWLIETMTDIQIDWVNMTATYWNANTI